jgi:hypothetical protein
MNLTDLQNHVNILVNAVKVVVGGGIAIALLIAICVIGFHWGGERQGTIARNALIGAVFAVILFGGLTWVQNTLLSVWK